MQTSDTLTMHADVSSSYHILKFLKVVFKHYNTSHNSRISHSSKFHCFHAGHFHIVLSFSYGAAHSPFACQCRGLPQDWPNVHPRDGPSVA